METLVASDAGMSEPTGMLTYSDRIQQVFYTFCENDRILQNTSRTHKNTHEYEQIPSESTKFCESARIPQNTVRIPRRIRILQEFTQNTEAIRIPLKNTAQNTRKNTVFFIVFRIR